jgi:hypothetical protein
MFKLSSCILAAVYASKCSSSSSGQACSGPSFVRHHPLLASMQLHALLCIPCVSCLPWCRHTDCISNAAAAVDSAAADGSSSMVRGPLAGGKNWQQSCLTSPICGSLDNQEVQFGEWGEAFQLTDNTTLNAACVAL